MTASAFDSQTESTSFVISTSTRAIVYHDVRTNGVVAHATSMSPKKLGAASDKGGEKRVLVAQSRFAVPKEMTGKVQAAFRSRPHQVDDVSGFVRMEVYSSIDAPHEFWLTTFWADEQSFRSWRRSHAFREAHKSLHDLKVVRGSFHLRFFKLICQ